MCTTHYSTVNVHDVHDLFMFFASGATFGHLRYLEMEDGAHFTQCLRIQSIICYMLQIFTNSRRKEIHAEIAKNISDFALFQKYMKNGNMGKGNFEILETLHKCYYFINYNKH